MKLSFELNIALIPENNLAERHIAASQELATHYPAIVALDNVEPRLALAPHLTLYQVPIPYENLGAMDEALADIAHTAPTPDLRCTGYAYNEGEASFEASYATTPELIRLQAAVINRLNPLRNGLLLERDPAGNTVSALLADSGRLGENLRQTGYSEVGDPKQGGLFRPHVTLNWFKLGTVLRNIDSHVPAPENLHGRYPKLGAFLLGPHGTCPQRLAEYDLAA